MATDSEAQAHRPQLGLWDAVSIIVGIIIGAGIYETPPRIFSGVSDPTLAYSIWAMCGILALIGALCYAELATAYPRDGGDYVYLTRSYGPLVGYLFGWTQLAVIQTASIGLMAYIFADYGSRLFVLPLSPDPEAARVFSNLCYAGSAIIGITLLNLAGVRTGKGVQNFLTLVKIVGLAAIVVAAFGFSHRRPDTLMLGTVIDIEPGKLHVYADQGYGRYDEENEAEARDYVFTVDPKTRMQINFNSKDVKLDDFAKNKHVVVVYEREGSDSVARLIRTIKKGTDVRDLMMVLVFVLLTYGGWNDAAFVAAEVKDPNRNIPQALIIGTLGVMGIYLLINYAYVRALGWEGVQHSDQIAADVLNLLPGGHGEPLMCILVMISALGAIQGLTFTSSRVYSTLGGDYSLFSGLARINPRTDVPTLSLVIQMLISVTMVVGVSPIFEGQSGVELLLDNLGMSRPESTGRSGFDRLLQCTAPVFWAFFLMTALAVINLRIQDRDVPRPFKVPAFPILPLIFIAMCGYMLYSGSLYAGELGFVGWGLVLAGVPLYVLSRRTTTSVS